MCDKKTVLARLFLLLISLTLMSLSDSSLVSTDEDNVVIERKFYIASPDMLYYPEEGESLSVFLDDDLINKEASEPVEKSEEDCINDYVELICESYSNVTPELVESVILSESSYNPKAKNGNHVGLMQVSTKWHKDRASNLGVEDLYDPYGNILVGVNYLDELIAQTDGDVAWALMIYNMGHKKAYELYSQGIISSYASTILSRI